MVVVCWLCDWWLLGVRLLFVFCLKCLLCVVRCFFFVCRLLLGLRDVCCLSFGVCLLRVCRVLFVACCLLRACCSLEGVSCLLL